MLVPSTERFIYYNYYKRKTHKKLNMPENVYILLQNIIHKSVFSNVSKFLVNNH